MNWKRMKKQLCTAILAFSMMAAGLGISSIQAQAGTKSLSNPTMTEDAEWTTGKRTVWDRIQFGSYPQTEIVAKAEDSCLASMKDYDATYASYYEIDADLYEKLVNVTDWDADNYTVIDGEEYKKVDTHYFHVEPITWRVLSVDGNKALVLADQILDYQLYFENGSWTKKCSYNISTIRSWLNGYDGSANYSEIDYSNNNFIDRAFTEEEQKSILITNVDNTTDNDGPHKATYSGSDTKDKIFLLSYHDLYTEAYGFTTSATKTSLSSAYAKALGLWTASEDDYFQGSPWMLRTTDAEWYEYFYYYMTADVTDSYYIGQLYKASDKCGIRPACYINLSTADYEYLDQYESDSRFYPCWKNHTESTVPGTPATCTESGTSDKIICAKCGIVLKDHEVTQPDPDNHTLVTESGYDSTCTETGKTDKITCSSCGKILQKSEIIPAKGHVEVIDVEAVPATCTSNGCTAVSHCSVCNQPVSEREIIPKLGHKETAINEKPATLKDDGNTAGICCANCGKVFEETEVIPKISKVSLSYTTTTYSGSAKSPTVKVTDREGTILTENTDYVVSKSSGRKNVGTYTYTITFFGKYDGTTKLTLTINPKGTTLSKLTALTKSFKVTWKKNATQTSGYQLQYSTSSTFKSAKTVTVSGTKTTSRTIKSLKAKTKYYVRIRTYKTVSGKKYYSAWSAKKYVKTK